MDWRSEWVAWALWLLVGGGGTVGGLLVAFRARSFFLCLLSAFSAADFLLQVGPSLAVVTSWYRVPPSFASVVCRISAAASLFGLFLQVSCLGIFAIGTVFPFHLRPLAMVLPLLYSAVFVSPVVLVPQSLPVRYIPNRLGCGLVGGGWWMVCLLVGGLCLSLVGVAVCRGRQDKGLTLLAALWLALVGPHTALALATLASPPGYFPSCPSSTETSAVISDWPETPLLILRSGYNAMAPAAAFFLFHESRTPFRSLRWRKNKVGGHDAGDTPVLMTTEAGLVLRECADRAPRRKLCDVRALPRQRRKWSGVNRPPKVVHFAESSSSLPPN